VRPPQRPTQIAEPALACLDAIAASGLGERISLGGAFGLAHYFEYRPTHDVDAWWREPVTAEERHKIIRALEEALRRFGPVRTRVWGDVMSVELREGQKTVFSFQIARRSAELQTPVMDVWPGNIGLDSFDDLLASKMTALIERGAPRDFRDIYALCQYGCCDLAQCWQVWETRQRLASLDAGRERATLAICAHLARFAQARPLASIARADERAAAEKLRAWFKTEFVCGFPN
jgi:hypothetical protein